MARLKAPLCATRHNGSAAARATAAWLPSTSSDRTFVPTTSRAARRRLAIRSSFFRKRPPLACAVHASLQHWSTMLPNLFLASNTPCATCCVPRSPLYRVARVSYVSPSGCTTTRATATTRTRWRATWPRRTTGGTRLDTPWVSRAGTGCVGERGARAAAGCTVNGRVIETQSSIPCLDKAPPGRVRVGRARVAAGCSIERHRR